MIKTFEEFINESSYWKSSNPVIMQSRDKYIKEFVSYLFEIGMSKRDCMEIESIMKDTGIIYSPAEAEDIFLRLPGEHSNEDNIEAVKTLFFVTDEDDNFNEYCDREEAPVVRDLNGKLLTGTVYYSETLGKYGKDEEDFYELVSSYADEEGVLDDDQPDWVDDNWDKFNIYSIDLDKKYQWRDWR